ncbi:MAG: protein kinase [bacterium]
MEGAVCHPRGAAGCPRTRPRPGADHRDLKPHNVLIPLGSRRSRLTDFGLAHALDRHADDPWRGHLAGTPNYMAPEQIECRWRDYGPWTDLYAFGCLAWSLVTGVPPFAARDPGRSCAARCGGRRP